MTETVALVVAAGRIAGTAERAGIRAMSAAKLKIIEFAMPPNSKVR